METFISYSSDIKRTAGKIKAYLDNYEFNCFLAHEDIPLQTVWPAEILKVLEKCNLFLPLLTPGFTTSFFCQQETGFAHCRKVEILPVMISKAPMGMIANIQAVRFNKKQFKKSCWKIVEHVAKNTSLSKPILDALIKEFGESSNYDDACEWAEKLINKFSFTRRQVREIKKHIKNNSQINETKQARDKIFQFMKKYPSFFDDEFVKWYDKKSRTHMRY
ncbi:MAG: toll/interleukin-1 receptor domain-containing protein [Planctomycetota bacterium]|jgi:hypothetical protein